MSDLQCPATLVLLTALGDGAALAEPTMPVLRERRVVAVYAVPELAGAAERIGRELGVAARANLEPVGPAYQEVLGGLVDLHRGETVVVVVPPDTLTDLQRALLGPATVDPGAAVVVSADADGWVVAPAEA